MCIKFINKLIISISFSGLLLLSGLASAQGDYSIGNNVLTYTVSADTFNGKINLPPVDITCKSGGNVAVSFNVEVSNFTKDSRLDISILDKINNISSPFESKKLDAKGPIAIKYSQFIGNLSSKAFLRGPYSSRRFIDIHGQFNNGMQLVFSNLQASTEDHVACDLQWVVGIN